MVRPATKLPPAITVGAESPAAGLTVTPSSVTSLAAAIRPVMLVPDGSDELKAPSEKATKLAAFPSDAHWAFGLERRALDVAITAEHPECDRSKSGH